MKNRIMLITVILFISVCNLATANPVQIACSQADQLIAHYEINRAQQKVQLNLVRDKHQVAHQYPQTNITEAWELNPSNKIKPTRFFDAHARAIEYQPGESVHGRNESDWSYRYQLMSDKMLTEFKLVEVTGKACDKLQLKEYVDKQVTMKLSWSPATKLIHNFEVINNKTQNTIEKWTLLNTHKNDQQISNFFEQRYAYLSTDFADIGDDHTDPFLTQMLNLGFIEHAHSGFYNQDGHAIRGQHDHAH
ncbi:hypothetical protein [Glaciecola sp. KUL10]|uniref:hypothetical protein n=1 Tax=Glaciecola sp. (strain KUL10) TaxID=2161813 RepID=UPI000D788751|nr:hypothetical protein [Glaciecola sp. KUL10]GBL05458.1 secreted protein [Glaciecola sp. KUL10]